MKIQTPEEYFVKQGVVLTPEQSELIGQYSTYLNNKWSSKWKKNAKWIENKLNNESVHVETENGIYIHEGLINKILTIIKKNIWD